MSEPFQAEVDRWLVACFGEEIARDRTERNHRFLEEALELVQAGCCTRSEAHQLVDYVFNRPVGEMKQEVGGVMNTLAALCLAYGEDMVECGNVEIARCWTKVEKIRAKQAAKPKHSPLPEHVASAFEASQARIAQLEEALGRITDNELMHRIRDLVAGWNGEGRPEGERFGRHPDSLGAKLPTTCGEVYALDAAIISCRALLAAGEPQT